MQPEAVAERVRQELPDCEIHVENEGNHYLVVAVGERFKGMTPVKKQQLIYGALNDELADGTIHALTIRAFTPEQWAERQ
ncbi:acid stress-induced BolA-like protein IbaG/YrbA [Tamilnaduibacter salinus]|uniref:Acid stress-induced BolA-like protein IbaG/YrbA n=1 Tax=Tamilnaduibacter salinus TaxID=1484056 RepID=A0A2A2I0S7_9GAMM|nr:BolA/IbaG family iron-sulfur metabolism protein [Tamilnaduibacter salinus]PAV25329.1 cell division protein BolA [Tamilnaduibacter salinus]PVY70771.1 acid stress-induced BolA-like protein IbaG/YrbA [Tamilnaduibacter salinus]